VVREGGWQVLQEELGLSATPVTNNRTALAITADSNPGRERKRPTPIDRR
jgi:hypothetical protein